MMTVTVFMAKIALIRTIRKVQRIHRGVQCNVAMLSLMILKTIPLVKMHYKHGLIVKNHLKEEMTMTVLPGSVSLHLSMQHILSSRMTVFKVWAITSKEKRKNSVTQQQKLTDDIEAMTTDEMRAMMIEYGFKSASRSEMSCRLRLVLQELGDLETKKNVVQEENATCQSEAIEIGDDDAAIARFV
eukprot:4023827-Ditylum_brightwellii.AAC.1